MRKRARAHALNLNRQNLFLMKGGGMAKRYAIVGFESLCDGLALRFVR